MARTSTIVITGTDTDVGKTVFAAGLVGMLGAHYWKPVQAGRDGDGLSDSDHVAMLSGAEPHRIVPPVHEFATPCSPHRAAEIDGIAINPLQLDPPLVQGPLVIEGAGGVLVPLTHDALFADLFARWGHPVVLVARTALGTINHSLLSLEALRTRGVPLLGIAFVGEANEDSEATIAALGRVRRLGRLPHLLPLDRETLVAAFAAHFDPADFQC